MQASGYYKGKERAMKSFLSWMGGKSLLTSKIIPLIPDHTTYVEPFAGAAWVLFGKEPSKSEILNDINSELICLYRIAKHHLEEFIRCLKFLLTSREEFERFKSEQPENLTDIHRAVRFYYLIKCGYVSRVDNLSFSVSPQRRPRFNLLRIEEDLSDAHIRLSSVYVENKPYSEIFSRYDRESTFFYVDPPYHQCENYYGKGIFKEEDFKNIIEILQKLKGKFIMSLNDTPFVRDLYGEFYIQKVPTTYSAGGGNKKKKVEELLLMNFSPPKKYSL